MLSVILSRGLAVVATIAVAVSGLLPAPHAHVDLIHSTVHAHAVADQVARHRDNDEDHDADHHDTAAFDHGGHASALTLLQSYDVLVRFVLATATLEVAVVNDSPTPGVRTLARQSLLPTHDPPLRFTSSPAPPALA